MWIYYFEDLLPQVFRRPNDLCIFTTRNTVTCFWSHKESHSVRERGEINYSLKTYCTVSRTNILALSLSPSLCIKKIIRHLVYYIKILVYSILPYLSLCFDVSSRISRYHNPLPSEYPDYYSREFQFRRFTPVLTL